MGGSPRFIHFADDVMLMMAVDGNGTCSTTKNIRHFHLPYVLQTPSDHVVDSILIPLGPPPATVDATSMVAAAKLNANFLATDDGTPYSQQHAPSSSTSNEAFPEALFSELNPITQQPCPE